MPSKYYLTLTTYGSDLIAQAHESAPLNLTNLVIGDANGFPYDPLTAIDRTHLVNQKASVLIQHLEVIEDVVRVTATIGAQIGGFQIHEIGLTDDTGQLVYIGNYHGGYKSLFEDGAGGELTISIDIKGVAANNISLSVDPNINTATQAWVQQKLNEMMDAINRKEDIKVGDLFITTTLFADSDAVNEHKGFGVWQKFGDGHALVLRSTVENENVPEWMSTIGNTGGEAEHRLTLAEMAKHKHSQSDIYNKFVGMADDAFNANSFDSADSPGLTSNGFDNVTLDKEIQIGSIGELQQAKMTEVEVGESQPHNNIQPSIIVDAWLRIA